MLWKLGHYSFCPLVRPALSLAVRCVSYACEVLKPHVNLDLLILQLVWLSFLAYCVSFDPEYRSLFVEVTFDVRNGPVREWLRWLEAVASLLIVPVRALSVFGRINAAYRWNVVISLINSQARRMRLELPR